MSLVLLGSDIVLISKGMIATAFCLLQKYKVREREKLVYNWIIQDKFPSFPCLFIGLCILLLALCMHDAQVVIGKHSYGSKCQEYWEPHVHLGPLVWGRGIYKCHNSRAYKRFFKNHKEMPVLLMVLLSACFGI